MSHDADSPFAAPPVVDVSPSEQKKDELSIPDLDIGHVENLSVISFVTKAIEDRLTHFFWPLYVPLLLIDIPLFCAVLLVNIERIIYTHLLDYFVAHVKYDFRIITNSIRKLLGRDVEQDEDDDEGEETFFGKLFYGIRSVIGFFWSIFIFALFLPVWPIIYIYNKFVEYILIGIFFYILLNIDIPGWEGVVIFYLLFGTVAFLISSISVPGLLKMFTYLKHLFSLERRPWREIRLEAKYAFLNLYVQIQKNKTTLMETVEPRYKRELKVEGGIYYLFLKTLHWCKDRLLGLPKKNVIDVILKLDAQLAETRSDISVAREQYEQTINEIEGWAIIKTLFALLITFAFSSLLVFKGSHAEGLLSPILFSFLEPDRGLEIWANYGGDGVGYYQSFFAYFDFIPAIVLWIISWIDAFLNIFFNLFHAFLPIYTDFIVSYYIGIWNMITLAFS